MIEDRARPSRGRMALRAVGRKSGLLVVRAGGAVIQRNMTPAAGSGRVGESPVRMTLAALHAGVRAGQGE